MHNSIATPVQFWAGGFLYNPDRHEVLLHLRDGNTKFNPNMWAFFGGLNEGPESPVECFIREVKEEIGLVVPPGAVMPLRDYLNAELKTHRYVFFVRGNVDTASLRLSEGAGFQWLRFSELNRYPLTEKTKADLEFFVDTFHGTPIAD